MFNIDIASDKPLYEQIVDNVKELALKNMLKAEDKLPSIREMASLLSVNPNTVSRAYKELENQNIIYTVRGRGTFLKEIDSNKVDDARIQKSLDDLKSVCIDLVHLGLKKEDIHKEIDNIQLDLEGGK